MHGHGSLARVSHFTDVYRLLYLLQTDMVVAKVITVLGAVMKDVRLSLYPPSKAIEKDQSRLQEVSFVRNLSSMQRMASHARLNEFMD